jgi:hypothetical protein
LIIPTRDAKSYGAVHIDHYLTFTGFCKKVYSDEIQSIDVLIDGQKVDTIPCDKTIEKVSKIYDIDGYGFEYDLPEIYFDRRHILSFRCSDSGEELVNSPISTIARDDEKFNEYKFLYSLSKPIDKDKIKNLYSPNAIGFLAIEDNLKDAEFINYIKELMTRFPKVEIKGFYFNNKQKEIIDNIFVSELKELKLKLIMPTNLYEMLQEIEIYIKNRENQQWLILMILLFYTPNSIYGKGYIKKPSGINQIEAYEYNYNYILNNSKHFGINIIENSAYKSIYNNILSTIGEKAIDLNDDYYEFENFLLIKYALKNRKFISYMSSLHHKYFQWKNNEN